MDELPEDRFDDLCDEHEELECWEFVYVARSPDTGLLEVDSNCDDDTALGLLARAAAWLATPACHCEESDHGTS